MDSDRLSTATVIPPSSHYIGTSTGGVRAHKRTGYFSTLPLPSIIHRITHLFTRSLDRTFRFGLLYVLYLLCKTTANHHTYNYFLEFSAAGIYIVPTLNHSKRLLSSWVADIYIYIYNYKCRLAW